MKVLFILNTTVMGGGNISFINMIKGLHGKNVKCYIVSPDDVLDKSFSESADGCVEKYYYAHLKGYIHDDLSYWNGLRKIKKFVKLILKNNFIVNAYLQNREDRELDDIVKQVRPDIIHTNVGVLQAGYKCAKRNQIPHIWHLREYQTKDFHWVIEPSYKVFCDMLQGSYVISITKDILNYFRLDNYSSAKCIYNGCFSIKDADIDLNKDNYFLCCSRISPEKGHKDVVKAFSAFYKKYPSYRLVIAGFGDAAYIEDLKHDASNLGTSDAIKFIGFQKDVKPLMKKAKALIVSSRFEGFGRMTAEAAFLGCPVIGHNTGGTKEILNITGGLAYLGGSEELEKKMEEVANMSPEIYNKMAHIAQEKAVQCFSIESNVEKIYSFYKEILNETLKKF